jgi:hypothetical protein
MQRAAERLRGDDGNLSRGELGDERMLFENRRIGPPSRSIELDDDGGASSTPIW